MKFRLAICFVLMFLLPTGAETFAQETSFYLKKNDRVLFYGDSITEQAYYTNYIETFVVTRFPNLDVSFVNSGWSGDKIWGGDGGTLDERLKRDVFPYRPTVLTAMYGMNDGCYIEFNADCYKAFTEHYERFLILLRKDLPDLRITLLEPSPFDDWTASHTWRLAPPLKNGYNNVLLRYAQFVRELANTNKLLAVNLNEPVADVIKGTLKEGNGDFAGKIIPDRIHPREVGGLLMAAEILQAWNASEGKPSLLIDGSGNEKPIAKNVEFFDFTAGKEISWLQLDEALPFPFEIKDRNEARMIKTAAVSKMMNNQMLRVNGLKFPSYTLKIDGQVIGVLTAESLTEGIDLSLLPTPMMKQALAVHKLTQEHNKIHFLRWRQIAVSLGNENLETTADAIEALDRLEQELIRKQKELAKPVKHRFELVPKI